MAACLNSYYFRPTARGVCVGYASAMRRYASCGNMRGGMRQGMRGDFFVKNVFWVPFQSPSLEARGEMTSNMRLR